MPVVLTQIPECLEFANKVLGVKFDPMMARWISNIGTDGKLLGVVVLDRFSPWNCELSAASVSPKTWSKAMLKAVFKYCFTDLNLCRVTAVVEDGNITALEFDKRLGFVQEARLKDWYGEGKDGIALRMLRAECRWIEGNNHDQIQH